MSLSKHLSLSVLSYSISTIDSCQFEGLRAGVSPRGILVQYTQYMFCVSYKVSKALYLAPMWEDF